MVQVCLYGLLWPQASWSLASFLPNGYDAGRIFREQAIGFFARSLFARRRVDLGDIVAKELHYGRTPLVALLQTDKDSYTGCFCLGKVSERSETS